MHQLTASLQHEIGSLGNLSKLVDSDLYQPEPWKSRLHKIAGNSEKALAALIPSIYASETIAERLDAYAGDLARKVRLSYPTHVVARMLGKQDLALTDAKSGTHTAVSKFLANATGLGFELGRTPVGSFLARHKDGLFAGMKAEEIDTTVHHVKQLHRVHQITPNDEALKGLLSAGLTSAHDIARLPYEGFIARYGHHFPSLDEAGLVYRKAEQVTTTTLGMFTMAKGLAHSPGLFAMSSPPEHREAARQNLVKHFPSMEQLFGSLDFCECTECRSVLSPAAYLVDLLQYLDHSPNDWHAHLADWKKKHNNTHYPFLHEAHRNDHLTKLRSRSAGKPDPKPERTPYEVFTERRPDIPHLPLTCENTNTVMPYIDIVNEILEYFVAHDGLRADSVGDTGDATTPELLAEPQNIQPLAYDTLRRAKYPITLPFDLWLETVRRFLDHSGTKLPEVLEVFRSSDRLFAFAADPKAYHRADIFAESLCLSPSEYSIFTDPLRCSNGLLSMAMLLLTRRAQSYHRLKSFLKDWPSATGISSISSPQAL